MNRIIAKKIETENIGSERKYNINNNNWNYKSDVVADFNIGYDDNNLYLNYFVKESNTRAINTNFNEPVYEDSCVEFFISFDGKNYYNLEFNCIGNILGGYGPNRDNRTSITKNSLKLVRTKPSLGRNKIEITGRETKWNLKVVIPKSLFEHDEIVTFEGLTARCNFYKCGDKQVYPHYLSWNPIAVSNPDFHLPEFFGEILFEA